MPSTKEPCPTPRKQAFGNERTADQFISAQWRKQRGHRLPTRSYLCRCGKWHVTSQAKGKPRIPNA